MHRRGPIIALSLASVVALAGCGGGGGRGIHDNDVTYKVPAIKDAVAANDQSSIPILVAGLRSEDPAVRFYSIEGLKRLNSGETFGYRYYDDVPTRKPAVQKWNQWLADRDKK